MKNKKYPASLFIMGTILNLIRTWYIFAASIFFFIMRIYNENFPVWIPLVILSAWIVLALIKQLRFRYIALKMQGNIGDILQKILSGNEKAPQDIDETVEELIKNIQIENIPQDIKRLNCDEDNPFGDY